MKIDVLTIFPDMFGCVLNESIIKRARSSGRVKIDVHNLRRWTRDRHKSVDDKPFGGGAGMVMKPDPIFKAVDKLKKKTSRIVLLTPQGKTLNQRVAKRLAKAKHLILICAHYEGVDERVRKNLATDEVSIGDYILTCGELPAMVLIDSVTRLIPGVLGHKDSAKFESFEDNLLEHPQYTRPAVYKGLKVPEVLLSGNHGKIKEWRKVEAVKRTKKRRPDLIGGRR
ncbi:MAG: tRNA (guanosine(37)-N1)-methyltransferase TrmD [Candidatus Omnitrophica bacterium]|nr:tRNA (guanosine(37)-N1)-methyltransferase TrmD [Candidatus Omnitrophota bacterium]